MWNTWCPHHNHKIIRVRYNTNKYSAVQGGISALRQPHTQENSVGDTVCGFVTHTHVTHTQVKAQQNLITSFLWARKANCVYFIMCEYEMALSLFSHSSAEKQDKSILGKRFMHACVYVCTYIGRMYSMCRCC